MFRTSKGVWIGDKKYIVIFKLAFFDKIYFACKIKKTDKEYIFTYFDKEKEEFVIEENSLIIERLKNDINKMTGKK
ncbi:MAG: hypothetical protein RSE00_02115 [Clostridia bacterium]